MIALIYIKSFYNAVVFIISVFALMFALSFVDQVNNTILPEAPKATQDLQKVFVPPIYRMQWFVFSFDALVCLYYIYQWPVWDCIKSKFPFFQYEAKTSEKADCTNLLLTVMFDLISKVSYPNIYQIILGTRSWNHPFYQLSLQKQHRQGLYRLLRRQKKSQCPSVTTRC